MTIQIDRIPDEYRGELDCLAIKTKHQKRLMEQPDERKDQYEILVEGEVVGVLERWYGSNGKGKRSADWFSPAEGVEVVYRDNE